MRYGEDSLHEPPVPGRCHTGYECTERLSDPVWIVAH